jgi:signal peptidase I
MDLYDDSQSPAPREISETERRDALRTVNRRGLAWAWEWAKSFSVTVVLILIVRTFLLDIFRIPSSSMEGTLLVGDILFVNKLAYGAEVPFSAARLPPTRVPQRGELIVFKWPVDHSKAFVKRLVGLPGDTIAMRRGELSVNGVIQQESFARRNPGVADPMVVEFDWLRRALLPAAHASAGAHPTRNTWGPLVVPVGNYFMLGDNRDNSSDSRYWGFVSDSLLLGQPMLVYYSVVPDSVAHGSWLSRVRWHRIGEWVH